MKHILKSFFISFFVCVIIDQVASLLNFSQRSQVIYHYFLWAFVQSLVFNLLRTKISIPNFLGFSFLFLISLLLGYYLLFHLTGPIVIKNEPLSMLQNYSLLYSFPLLIQSLFISLFALYFKN